MAKHLQDAAQHLDEALEHSLAGRHSAARSKIRAAQKCIERAIDETPAAEHDAVTNPTAATGAQVSNGQSPRSLDPEIRRQHDQLRSCQIAFDVRQRQMRGIR